MGDGNFRWWIAEGRYPENYRDDYPIREAAIADAWGYWPDGNFTIIEADKECARLPDGERIFETFIDANDELGGDDYFGEDVSPTKEQFAELTTEFRAMFQSWLDRHKLNPHVWRFGETRSEEYFPIKEEKSDDS